MFFCLTCMHMYFRYDLIFFRIGNGIGLDVQKLVITPYEERPRGLDTNMSSFEVVEGQFDDVDEDLKM